MAKGWRKDDYNRQIFGQRVKEYRTALDCSLGELAQLSDINKGTLLHVEQGQCSLPNTKRQALIDVLTEELEKSGHSVDRREFLQVASLSTLSSNLSTESSAHRQIEMFQRSSVGHPLQEMSHEKYAEQLNEQQKWQEATTFWLLAVREAKQHGDWATWSRCLLRAGLMALTCGQYELAERRFKEVITSSQYRVSELAVIEAYVDLGWVCYERDKFSQASQVLLKCGALLRNVVQQHPDSYFPNHGATIPYEDYKVILALESTRLHWLGRTYVDWGIQQDNQVRVQEGIAKLEKAKQYDSRMNHSTNVGFELLRQIPGLLHQGELSTTETYLTQGQELTDMRGKGKGHIYLYKGLVVLEEQPKKARDFLEIACANFAEPPFYSKGLSEAFKELSSLYLMDNKQTGDEKAFEYALATVVLHPYNQNLEVLQLTAYKMYWRLGENRTSFNTYWQALKEKLWSMQSEPFTNLRYLMHSFPEHGIQRIEVALEEAERAIQNELFRG